MPASSSSGFIPHSRSDRALDVWLKARDAKALDGNDSFLETARKADVLMRGLAHVGIIALVDEATGYQKQKDEYQKVLSEWIAQELRPWVHTFDEQYYKEIYRLNGWTWDAFLSSKKKQHPQVVGHFTNRIVYEKLAPGLLDVLKKISPKNAKGNRKTKHHTRLSENKGYVALIKHIASVTTIMEQFPDGGWQDAIQRIDSRYPTLKLGWQLSFDFPQGGDKGRMDKAIEIAAQSEKPEKRKAA